MKFKSILVGLVLFADFVLGLHCASAKDRSDSQQGLQNTTVLIIRHGEQPSSGPGLSALGQKRADAYVSYFQNLTLDSTPAVPNYLMSAADSAQSQRPHLTLVPLSKALNLPINDKLTFKQGAKLAKELQDKSHGKVILICWHHSAVPDLLKALGADPNQLLPKGKWPDEVYNYVLRLSFDGKGALIPASVQRMETNFSLD
jgi:hypothetical protein